MHSRNIAHLDICLDNFVYEKKVDAHGRLIPPGQPYMIDFEMSRELPLGPGRQPAIDLPPSQMQKPDGVTRLDPYSWDMRCFGDFCFVVLEVRPFRARRRPRFTHGVSRLCMKKGRRRRGSYVNMWIG